MPIMTSHFRGMANLAILFRNRKETPSQNPISVLKIWLYVKKTNVESELNLLFFGHSIKNHNKVISVISVQQ